MNPETVVKAAGLFAVTNVDDIVVLALFFAQAAGRAQATRTIAAGQYLGFAGILALAVAAAFGATFLPESALPYLGLLPLALGIRVGLQTWMSRRDRDETGGDERRGHGPTVFAVAAVTFANGGDNIGVYVPVFVNAGAGDMAVYVAVFLVLVGVWVAAGRFVATRPAIAQLLSRWAHVLLPAVLVGIGLLILIEGGAFGM